jgi:hypothetical protein
MAARGRYRVVGALFLTFPAFFDACGAVSRPRVLMVDERTTGFEAEVESLRWGTWSVVFSVESGIRGAARSIAFTLSMDLVGICARTRFAEGESRKRILTAAMKVNPLMAFPVVHSLVGSPPINKEKSENQLCSLSAELLSKGREPSRNFFVGNPLREKKGIDDHQAASIRSSVCPSTSCRRPFAEEGHSQARGGRNPH